MDFGDKLRKRTRERREKREDIKEYNIDYTYGDSNSYSSSIGYEYEYKEENLPELKYIDTEIIDKDLSGNWSNENPTGDCLNTVAIGDGPSDRDGRVYYIHSVKMNITFTTTSIDRTTLTQDDVLFAFALVLDKQTNSAQVEPSKVFDTGVTLEPLAFRKMEFKDRYVLIEHCIGNLKRFQYSDNPGTTNVGVQRMVYRIKHTFKKPLEVICVGSGSTVTVCTSNSLGFLAVSTVEDLMLSYTCRIKFSG